MIIQNQCNNSKIYFQAKNFDSRKIQASQAARSTCNTSVYDYSSRPNKLLYDAYKANMISFSQKINKPEINLEEELSSYLFKRASDIEKLTQSGNNNSSIPVGHLPDDWSDKTNKSENLIATIGRIVSEFRNGTSQQETEQTLQKSLSRFNIIQNDEDINLKYTGKGGYGIVYSFVVNNKKYALKIFYQPQDTENDYHGCLIETNRAMFLNKHLAEKDFVKFYFADLKNGFQLNEFIDQDEKSHQCDMRDVQLRLSLLGLRHIDDKLENTLNGKIIDYGGLEITSDRYIKK